MTEKVPVVTIDGPSGAGKGALCKALSNILMWHFLDSGSIYRVLALAALIYQIDISSEKSLLSLVTHLHRRCSIQYREDLILLKKKDVSQEIRTEKIGHLASKIAQFPLIRKALLFYQRSFKTLPGLIADGRDMGTLVFPDAPVKIFLDASSKERAYRRMVQLQEKGFNVNFKGILSEIEKRDNRDRNRAIAPLVPATDAIVLDSTILSIEEVITKALLYTVNKLKLVI